jgi:hypothetical protein
VTGERLQRGFQLASKNPKQFKQTYSELKHRHCLSQNNPKKSWKLKSAEEYAHSD